MSRPTWAPDNVPLDKPSPARMYDYFLGGYHNFEIDRKAADQATSIYPDFPLVMRVNRAFLRRAVRYLAGQGIEQFLDIGSGIPTVGNVHEVAQRIAPDARVAYVDIDPIAVSHARALLADNPGAVALHGNLREPDRILADPALRELFDLDQPVAVLLLAVLHFVADANRPDEIIGTLRDALAPGSYLVISHGTDEGRSTEALEQVYRNTVTPLAMRDRAQVRALFAGFELLEPGVVWAPQWHPDQPEDVGTQPERSGSYVGVGRRP